MINVIEFRIGNYCHARKEVKTINLGGQLSKTSALDKIRAAVKDTREETIYQVASINRKHEIELSSPVNEDILKFLPEEIFPVKLTTSLLRECGFMEKTFNTKDLVEKYLTIEGFIPIRVSEYRERTHFSVYVFDKHTEANTFLRDLKYLHQLQNIYFELSGKALEINPSLSNESAN
jgi:hypothetical protein